MKKIQVILCLFLIGFGSISINAQEKKIKFKKGTLTICSKKTFLIEGYDGKEVIIEPLHEKNTNSYSYNVISGAGKIANNKTKEDASNSSVRIYSSGQKASTIGYAKGELKTGTKNGKIFFYKEDLERKEGLKKLGKTNENEDLGIYFFIELKEDELFFKDQKSNGVIMRANEKYKLKIPNSIKLNWLSGNCTSNKKKVNNNIIFLNSDESSITNFEGEVVINNTMRNTKLVDVSGPVSLNSLGGNFTIVFDKKRPSELYSIYTNNGFIDVTLPKNSSLTVKATGKSIFSDLDFKLLSEEEVDDFGHIKQVMNLKLNSGAVKMNLNADYGNVYLRKQK